MDTHQDRGKKNQASPRLEPDVDAVHARFFGTFLGKLERARELLRELPDGLGELHEDGRAVVARAVHAPGGWTGERGAAQL